MRYYLKLFVLCVCYFGFSYVGLNILHYIVVKSLYKPTVLYYDGSLGGLCLPRDLSVPHAGELARLAAIYGRPVLEMLFLLAGIQLLKKGSTKAILRYLGIIFTNCLLITAIGCLAYWIEAYQRYSGVFLAKFLSKPLTTHLILAATLTIPIFALRWTIKKFLTKREILALLWVAPVAFCCCYVTWFYVCPRVQHFIWH